MVRVALATFALGALALQGQATDVTPVQKVLGMMREMKAKGELMLQQEAKTYAAYAEWVNDQERKLGFELETAESDIEELLATAAKADSDVNKFRNSISELETEMSTAESEKAEATKLRNSQHEEYVKLSTDYSESVDALTRAIQTLESKNYDVPQAMALLQSMSATKQGMRRVLAALIQEQDESSKGGPAVAAYEFQSGGIIQLLEKFLKKFQTELAEVESEEANQAHNYDLEMIHLSDTIAYHKKEIEEKSIFKAKRASESATAKSDLSSTRADRAEDQTTLKDMKATFAVKTDTFKANQEVRKQELEAISKAIEIISDPSVAASYGNHINLAQTRASFLQLRTVQSRVSARQRVAKFLETKAQLLSSEVLKTAASQAASNPFDKVIGMIRDLVAKLKEEAAAEAEHKTWCDGQLKSNKLKREKKTSKVNKEQATVDSLAESITSMGKRIATLGKQQADLQSAMAEATTQRQTEKATNAATMKDAAAGEEAVKQALVVLKEFYASQSSLLQKGGQVPEMAAYKGMQSANGGVVGMLEVISADFARLLADTRAEENAAASEYDAFMKDAKSSKKSKHDLEVKTSLEKDQAEFEKAQTVKDVDATQVELDKALAYQQHLKPVCLEVHVSYEERVANRQQEIQALKEAYEILDQK